MRFQSKKNRVTLEHGVVVKRYQDKESLFREARALEHLHQGGLEVPAVLDVEAQALKLEFIEGPTYVDLVESMTPKQAKALGNWLAKYHGITGRLRGDCNLRNFLWSKELCVGVDFEDEVTQGEREIDMGKILAFAVTYNPPFTTKKANSARLLLQAFRETGGEPLRIKNAYLHEIAAMNERRTGDAIRPQTAALFFDELV